MKSCLIGAIWGDACGAPYEGRSHKVYSSEEVHILNAHAHVTDDTIRTLAIARAILEGRSYAETVLQEAQRYPHAGWGRKFKENWVEGNNPTPYGSYANGSAMRVSPIGWAFDSIEDILREAKASSEVTHNHPDAIQAAHTRRQKSGRNSRNALRMIFPKVLKRYVRNVTRKGSTVHGLR